MQLVTLSKEKEEYYGGKAPAEVYKEKPFHLKLLKGDIPKYIQADPDIIRVASAIDIQEEKVYIIQEYMEKTNYWRWTYSNRYKSLYF